MVTTKFHQIPHLNHLTYALLAAWGRLGRTNAAKIECALRRVRKLLTDYNQIILTFHSIYDYFALFKACNTNTFNSNTFNLHQYFKDYLLINHLICTTSDTEQMGIFILFVTF